MGAGIKFQVEAIRHMILSRCKTPDTRFRNQPQKSVPDSGAGFSCRCATSNVIDCLRAANAVTDVRVVHRHEKLAPESGVEFIAPISGAGFWRVCQGPNIISFVGDVYAICITYEKRSKFMREQLYL